MDVPPKCRVALEKLARNKGYNRFKDFIDNLKGSGKLREVESTLVKNVYDRKY